MGPSIGVLTGNSPNISLQEMIVVFLFLMFGAGSVCVHLA